MKKSLTLALLTISFFSLIFSSCGKSGAISGPVVTPTPTPTPTTSGTKNYYVSDGTGSDGNTGLSINVPFKTITAGVNAAVAGDTVFIMNGTYTSSFTLTKSGTTDKYITYKNYATHKPKIVISGAIWSSVKISGNYIVFEGIEMQGNNANLTYAGALDAYNQYLATGVNNSVHAQYNTNAIDISTNNPHHIVIRNCAVHDFPGGGISGIGSDYLTLEGNIIYNNCWYMMYAGSGISILTPSNSDAADVNKYKNIIRNNIVYGNKCLIPWVSTKALSDGNGIIIDVNQLTSNSAAYTGRTLVENNVSFNNGGGGVH
ncbi:MAG: hypothetical protein H7101_06445, partial [Deinococcales bacterium]|nr:hypothetical protein [Chitinophagaceae bacterium]